MRYNINKASWNLKIGATVGLLFLHIPLLLIILSQDLVYFASPQTAYFYFF